MHKVRRQTLTDLESRTKPLMGGLQKPGLPWVGFKVEDTEADAPDMRRVKRMVVVPLAWTTDMLVAQLEAAWWDKRDSLSK